MSEKLLILACGALAREVLAVVEAGSWEHIDVRCLPAALHSRPREIADAVDAKIRELAGRYDHVFVAYADCGTAGALDEVLARHGVERLPGAHCYAVYAGESAWDDLQAAEPTFTNAEETRQAEQLERFFLETIRARAEGA